MHPALSDWQAAAGLRLERKPPQVACARVTMVIVRSDRGYKVLPRAAGNDDALGVTVSESTMRFSCSRALAGRL